MIKTIRSFILVSIIEKNSAGEFEYFPLKLESK